MVKVNGKTQRLASANNSTLGHMGSQLFPNEKIQTIPIAFLHKVFVDEVFSDPAYERDVIALLREATENDTVEFYVNSVGGNIAAAIPIVNAIRHTKANVVGILMAQAHSAASLVLLACPMTEINPHTEMLIHSATYGVYGKVGDVRDEVRHTQQYIEDIMDEMYANFLTQEEIAEVKNGREMFLRYDDIVGRLQNRATVLNAQFEHVEGGSAE